MGLKNKIHITCKDATLLICKKQEGAITFRESVQLKFHLLICKVCALFNIQSNQIHQHLQNMNREDNESRLIQLDETQKAILQNQINSELKK